MQGGVHGVAVTSCVCHATWLRNLLNELKFQMEDLMETFVDNKSAFA